MTQYIQCVRKVAVHLGYRELISRNVWPPHSPDLNPSDFYVWGSTKSAMYRDRPGILNELKTAVNAYLHKKRLTSRYAENACE
jgi:hypothetical protein